MRNVVAVCLSWLLVACVSSHDTLGHSKASAKSASETADVAENATEDGPSVGAAGGGGVTTAAPRQSSSTNAAIANPDVGATKATTQTATGLADIEFTMDVKVPVGGEKLLCMYVAMPANRGVMAVSGAESHYTPGSHHLLAYRSDLIGVPRGEEAPVDCDSSTWFLHNRGSYYEAQQPDSERQLPPGIAHKFQPNEVVILQAHYLNTTSAPLDAHVQLVMHTMDVAKVEYEAGSILFSNFNISIPPHTKMRATMTCPIPQDFNPALLWSHMHHRAANFIAHTDDDAAANALGVLYEEPDWNEPKPRVYPSDPPVTLHAGSHITFSCDFNNESDATISYGNSADKNEMCIFHGMYWPRMTVAGAESCRGGVTTKEML